MLTHFLLASSIYRCLVRIWPFWRKPHQQDMESLHWLPVSFRIVYKVSLLTHQCIHGDAPSYLKELLTPQSSKRTLRSASTYLLKTPRTKLRTMGDRAFCSAAPSLWNALPDHLRTPQPVDVFKRGLKTYLFSKAFE